jgi:hypothetical protein
MTSLPQGCHLVGSILLPDTETVFRECIERLPSRLKRIPDGETGNRSYFTAFQFAVFSSLPQCMAPFAMNKAAEAKDIPPAEVEENITKLRRLSIETGYETAAIESYAIFKRLKIEGIISRGVRFQVCLPTGASVVVALHHQYREAGFEVYEAALFRAMRRLQDAIPADELSIQIDLAVDTAFFWEGVYEEPWFEDVKEGTLRYTVRMIGQVDRGVELGLHNCYSESGPFRVRLPRCQSGLCLQECRRHGAQTLDGAAIPASRDRSRAATPVSHFSQDLLLSLPGSAFGYASFGRIPRAAQRVVPRPARPWLRIVSGSCACRGSGRDESEDCRSTESGA